MWTTSAVKRRVEMVLMAAQRGERIVIRPATSPRARILGIHPISYVHDLSAPGGAETIAPFYASAATS